MNRRRLSFRSSYSFVLAFLAAGCAVQETTTASSEGALASRTCKIPGTGVLDLPALNPPPNGDGVADALLTKSSETSEDGNVDHGDVPPLPDPGPMPARNRPLTVTLGKFEVKWTGGMGAKGQLTVTHGDEPNRVLFGTQPGRSFVLGAIGDAEMRESRGSFSVRDRIRENCTVQTVENVWSDDKGAHLSGVLNAENARDGGCGLRYTLTFQASSDHQLGFDLALGGAEGIPRKPEQVRAILAYGSERDESFFGFGEQYTYFDLKGKRVPILVQEQGIGRGRQPITFLLNRFTGSGGSWSSTYAAVPQYVTNKARSVFLENSEYSVFDLSKPDLVQVEVFSPSVRGRILHGKTPMDLVQEYTSYAGRMTHLPDWINEGAVVGMQGGRTAVYDKLKKLREVQTPVAAFWLQDWVGKRKTPIGSFLWWNWEQDEETYPDFKGMVSDLKSQGIRTMTYMNPFLVDPAAKKGMRRNLFLEAVERNLLVNQEDGCPLIVPQVAFNSGLLDVSNPSTREWAKEVIKREMLDAGVSGWMADFGEALPMDGKIAAPEGARSFHNRYPEEWARIHREAVREAGLDDEVVFFSRSGFTKSPGITRLFWLGDQMVTWDEHDGLKSAITGLVSGGISGYSLNHSDIGGYLAIKFPIVRAVRSKELFQRWAEFAAFTAVYRTHEGNLPDENHQFDSDQETLVHFAKFARVFKALAPYRKQLMMEAESKGSPLARAMVLEFPNDPNSVGLRHQFMLGSEYLVAPVTEPKAKDVEAYVPRGRWVNVWTGAVVESKGGKMRLPAPIGQPAVYHREGSAEGQRLREALKAQP